MVKLSNRKHVFGIGPRFKEQTAPATPPSGFVEVYSKTDGKMYRKDDAGVERELGSTIVPHSDVGEAVGTGGTSTSTLPVNLPVRCKIDSFVKAYADTKLILQVGSGLINNNSLGPIEIRVLLNSTLYLISSSFSNVGFACQAAPVTGLAAGTYAIEVQWSRPTATGTLVQSSGNRTTLTVTETY